MRHRRLLPLVAVLVIVAAGCDWPNVVPPGNAPVRYRDPIFNAVTVTSNVTYGSAVNLRGPDDHAAARHVPAHGRHGHESARDRVGPRRLVLLRQQDVARARRRSDHVRQGGIRERLDQLSARVAGLLGNAARTASRRFEEAAADAQTAVRFLRTNAATYGIDPNRIAIGGSSAGAITALNVGYSTSEDPSASVRAAVSLSGAQLGRRHHLAGRRSGPRLPLHDRPARAVSVGGEHDQRARRRRGSTRSSSPGTRPATCRMSEHRQQILDQSTELLVVGDGPRPRGNLSAAVASRRVRNISTTDEAHTADSSPNSCAPHVTTRSRNCECIAR